MKPAGREKVKNYTFVQKKLKLIELSLFKRNCNQWELNPGLRFATKLPWRMKIVKKLHFRGHFEGKTRKIAEEKLPDLRKKLCAHWDSNPGVVLATAPSWTKNYVAG